MRHAARLTIAFSSVLLLTACAQNVWHKPGASTQAFEADKYACERDARQSGGFGGGIAGAIEVQNFFNRCMSARGWSLQEKTRAEANAMAGRASVQSAIEQRKSCLREVRGKPQYGALSGYFSNPETGRFSIVQMSVAQNATQQEASAMLSYLGDARSCVDAYASVVLPLMSPEQAQIFRSGMSESEAISAQLIRRQISWGDYSTRLNQLFDTNQARERAILAPQPLR